MTTNSLADEVEALCPAKTHRKRDDGVLEAALYGGEDFDTIVCWHVCGGECHDLARRVREMQRRLEKANKLLKNSLGGMV